jgi:hypothetical protein
LLTSSNAFSRALHLSITAAGVLWVFLAKTPTMTIPTWSQRKLIIPRDPSPWAAKDPVYHEELAHRSPTPHLMRDGRILILFARRLSPSMGIGGMISEDGGLTWSPDIILRDDADPSNTTMVRGQRHDYADIGYPLMTELDDSRIFTAYYFLKKDGTGFGGSRFIAASFFRV